MFVKEEMELQPKTFEEEITTVWSFPDRGTWATHKGDFRGNWAPQVPRNLILRYSKEGDTVLDPMIGSGTTLIECKLLNRNGRGFDINPEHVKITKQRIDFEGSEAEIKVEVGDARNLSKIKDESIDLLMTHPPYADIIEYSKGTIEGDLSNIGNIEKFCDEIEVMAREFYRVLKTGKFCAILIGSTRKKGMFIPIPHMVLDRFLKVGFKLKEEIIKEQHNCSSTHYWKNQSKKFNFLLIMHESLFVFKKY
jgi:DNA modification methylase